MDVEEDEPIIKNFDKIQKEMEKIEKQKYTLEQLKNILEDQNIVPLSDDNKDELIFQIAQCKVNNIIPRCYMCGGGVLQFVNKKQRYECQGFDMDGEQIECKCYFMEDEIKKREWVEL
ncbi:hypothetical protein PPERSA_09381 [Pseudocohnilembus persalinus]|uniref:Uncharacterized protein n=1 Tax=Pseudocohnilembus persalinus TaxID=266149 RepID=A0A0V0QKX1_PSEPJ|nr:hypothetical protein PPERSA_09381 [Pseudocohnilembus persalinus]|eukprot:KRX02963.1 hypothetical protein PPERSA_09381 [Pseudocohnilembus persalinus]